MKKMFAWILALVMVCGLAACGTDPAGNGTGETTEPAVENHETREPTEAETDPPVSSGEITLEELMNHPESPESDFVCMDCGDGTVELWEYTGSDEIVVIPSMWNGKEISSIGAYVFANEFPVRAMRLSDSVEIISESAFGLNENLEIIVTGKGLRAIGEGAFQSCVNLHTVVLNDGLERMDGYAFSGCERLANIEIPDSVTTLDFCAFYDPAEDFVIIGTPGSAAETYANSEGITFRAK